MFCFDFFAISRSHRFVLILLLSFPFPFPLPFALLLRNVAQCLAHISVLIFALRFFYFHFHFDFIFAYCSRIYLEYLWNIISTVTALSIASSIYYIVYTGTDMPCISICTYILYRADISVHNLRLGILYSTRASRQFFVFFSFSFALFIIFDFIYEIV